MCPPQIFKKKKKNVEWVPTSSDGALDGSESTFSRFTRQFYRLFITTRRVVDPYVPCAESLEQTVRSQYSLGYRRIKNCYIILICDIAENLIAIRKLQLTEVRDPS